jgi:60 kDa SS-A/Ro ribonucleoprotein
MARIVYGNSRKASRAPQSRPIPGRTDMVKNNAGGFGFAVDAWRRLDRFLVLGVDTGTYYVGKSQMTRDNAKNVIALIKEDGVRVVQRIAEMAREGRVAKRDTLTFSLAACAALGDAETRDAAYGALTGVCRIPTDLFAFQGYFADLKGSRTLGRKHRRGITNWYNSQTPDRLAFLVSKYQSRNGWSHKDLVRMAHVKPDTPQHANVLAWSVYGLDAERGADLSPEYMSSIKAMEWAKDAKSAEEICQLVTEHRLSWEHIPTQYLNEKSVQAALIPNMGYNALIRSVNRLPVDPFTETGKMVIERIKDEESITRSRIHPFNILIGLKTYSQGRGFRGSKTWAVNAHVVEAMTDAFYKSFKNLEPTGKRVMLLVDVSSSMGSKVADTNISCSEAAAAMAMVINRQEGANAYTYGFSAAGGGASWSAAPAMKDLGITPNMRMDTVLRKTNAMTFGSTDCAAGIRFAAEKGFDVDAFVLLTDNESWKGPVHVTQAMDTYRRKVGHDVKLISCAFAASRYSVADPKDASQIDFVGLDAALPRLVSDFIADKF